MTEKLADRFAYTLVMAALVLGLGAGLQQAQGAGMDGGSDGSDEPSKIQLAKSSIRAGEYEAAIEDLEQLHEEDPKNADVLNLLGYSNRKLGKLDRAREYYLQALAIKPKHKGANEYLGELYLKTGELDKAEERLAVLDKACFFPCSEYSDLKEAIEKYKSDNGVQSRAAKRGEKKSRYKSRTARRD